jgi:hypothetical protein
MPAPPPRGVYIQAPFRLATGSTSEGRPDLVALLQAREPHEKLVHEGALEKRSFAEERREAAKSRESTSRSPLPFGRRRGSAGGGGAAGAGGFGDDAPAPPAKFGLAALGFVPPGMVASGTLNALAAGAAAAAPLGPLGVPAKRPAPPNTLGVWRLRERALDGKRPDLHALRQHDFSRVDRAVSGALDVAEATFGAVADMTADSRGEARVGRAPSRGGGLGGGGGGSGLGGGASFASSRGGGGGGAPFVPPLPLGALGDGGGDNVGGGATLVRVGVAAEELLDEALAAGVRAASAATSARLAAGPAAANASARPPSPTFPRGSPAASLVVTDDSVFDPKARVAFKMATADLPAAAVNAITALLDRQQRVTVADVHQRRPPFLDSGAPAEVPDAVLPANAWTQSLRRSLVPGSAASGAPKMAWKGGCIAPSTKSASTPSAMDTFDFFAREKAVRYYITDFTRPAPPPMRPPSRGVTRFAANVPSMVARTADASSAVTTARLL